ncbi:hypothetical protein CR513_23031, partial [Mucuna pruriens]
MLAKLTIPFGNLQLLNLLLCIHLIEIDAILKHRAPSWMEELGAKCMGVQGIVFTSLTTCWIAMLILCPLWSWSLRVGTGSDGWESAPRIDFVGVSTWLKLDIGVDWSGWDGFGWAKVDSMELASEAFMRSRPHETGVGLIMFEMGDRRERRQEKESYRERRHEEEPRRRYEEEPHKDRRERRYEEPHHERKRYFESPQRDERVVPRRAPMDALKYRIPPFVGDRDVESYLDWEIKVDQVLACFDYLDYEKVKMVTYEFIGRKRNADTWADLKMGLRSRFVPTSYARDLYNRLQCMYQGSKSVEEYHRDMEVALTRANVMESNKVTTTFSDMG